MDIIKKTLAILIILSLALIFGCAKKEEPAAEVEDTATEEAEVLAAQELTPKEELGRRLFFDSRLNYAVENDSFGFFDVACGEV